MKILDRILTWLILLTAFLMASQWSLPLGAGGKPILYVTCADILLGVAFLVWLYIVVSRRGWKEVRWPPLAWFGFLVAVLISAALAADRKMAVKETLQILELFVVAAFLFLNGLVTVRAWRQAVLALAVATTLILGLAVFQYFTAPNGFQIRGSFGNKNALAAFLAVVLPFLGGLAAWEGKLALRIWWVALFVVGLLVTLSAGAWIALIAATLLVAGLRSWKLLGVTSLVWALLLAFGGPLLRRPGHAEMLRSSVAFHIPANHYFTPRGVEEHVKAMVYLNEGGSPVGDANAALAFLVAYHAEYPGDPSIDAARDHLEKVVNAAMPPEAPRYRADLSGPPALTVNTRYIGWHASWRLIRSNRFSGFLGRGPGSFNKAVNQYYDAGGPLAKPSAEGRGGAADTYALTSDEPDSFNQYLVYAAELGLLGLFLFLCVIQDALGRAVAALGSTDPRIRGLALGVVGAVTGALLVAVFHPIVVRGLGVVLVFILSAAITWGSPRSGTVASGESMV
jgi:O-antigen ligase